ncbi:MAG TPA: hypothetical protein VGL03_07950 [Thermoanaerobaculia bacterium]
MRKETKKALKLSADHAAHALQMLIEDGKIAAGDVLKALRRREAMIQELRGRLAALEQGVSASVARAAKQARRNFDRQRPRAKTAISRAQRTARQAQGRYMAAIRMLSKEGRLKIKAVRERSGVDEAIKAAKKMAK